MLGLGRIFFAVAVFWVLPLVQPAWAENPDAGKKMRMVCFVSEQAGEEEAADKNIVLIVDQRDDFEYDASHFVPGNKLYQKPLRLGERAGIYLFKDASAVLGSSALNLDPKELASALLNAGTETKYLDLELQRARARMIVRLPEPRGSIEFNPEEPQYNHLFDNSVEERFIDSSAVPLFCHDPYGVEVE